MICRNCGNELRAGDIFCLKCGSAVQNSFSFGGTATKEETKLEKTFEEVKEEIKPEIEDELISEETYDFFDGDSIDKHDVNRFKVDYDNPTVKFEDVDSDLLEDSKLDQHMKTDNFEAIIEDQNIEMGLKNNYEEEKIEESPELVQDIEEMPVVDMLSEEAREQIEQQDEYFEIRNEQVENNDFSYEKSQELVSTNDLAKEHIEENAISFDESSLENAPTPSAAELINEDLKDTSDNLEETLDVITEEESEVTGEVEKTEEIVEDFREYAEELKKNQEEVLEEENNEIVENVVIKEEDSTEETNKKATPLDIFLDIVIGALSCGAIYLGLQYFGVI